MKCSKCGHSVIFIAVGKPSYCPRCDKQPGDAECVCNICRGGLASNITQEDVCNITDYGYSTPNVSRDVFTPLTPKELEDFFNNTYNVDLEPIDDDKC